MHLLTRSRRHIGVDGIASLDSKLLEHILTARTYKRATFGNDLVEILSEISHKGTQAYYQRGYTHQHGYGKAQ